MAKQGTPTMGGLMFIAAVAIAVAVLTAGRPDSDRRATGTSLYVLLFALVFGLIGFIDDYAEDARQKENDRPERPPEISAPAGGGHSCSLCCCATAAILSPNLYVPFFGVEWKHALGGCT